MESEMGGVEENAVRRSGILPKASLRDRSGYSVGVEAIFAKGLCFDLVQFSGASMKRKPEQWLLVLYFMQRLVSTGMYLP